MLIVLDAIIMNEPPTPAQAASSADPGRWAPAIQPEPVEYPNRSRTQRWGIKALVGQEGTGNAARAGQKATRQEWPSKWMYAATRDEVLLLQQQYIHDHLHPKASRWVLEPSTARSWASLGRFPSNFGM